MPDQGVRNSFRSRFICTFKSKNDIIEELKLLCFRDVGAPLKRVANLIRRLDTMDTLYLFPPDNNPQKTCTGPCGRTLPATQEFFHVGTRYVGGLRPQCKECRSKDRKEYYRTPEVYEKTRAQNDIYRAKPENQEREKERRKANSLLPETKEYHQKYGKAYRSKPENKTRISARMKTYNSTPERQKRIPKYREEYYSLPEKREYRSARAKAYTSLPAIQEHRRKLARAYYSRPEIHIRQLAHGHTRRARKKNAPGIHTPEQIQEQYKRQKGNCYYCKDKVKWGSHHVDHVVPLSRGGSNDISNLVISCPTCNLSKSNKLPHEFPEGGRLL